MSATENKRISIAGLKAAVKKDPAVFMCACRGGKDCRRARIARSPITDRS